VIAIDRRKIGDRKEKAFDAVYKSLASLQKEAEETDVEVELTVETGYGEGWAFVVRWIFKDEEDDTGVCVTGFTDRKYAKQFLDEFKAYAAKRYGRRFDFEPPELIPVTDWNESHDNGPGVPYLATENSGLLKVPLREFVAKLAERVEDDFKRAGMVVNAYLAIDANDRLLFFPQPFIGGTPGQVWNNKRRITLKMRRVFARVGAVRCCQVSEALLGAPRDTDPRPPSEQPDRSETVMLVAEDQREGSIQAIVPIIRHGDAAMLGALQFADEGGSIEGLMVGLLPAGTAQ
jgi:hypothetical protein